RSRLAAWVIISTPRWSSTAGSSCCPASSRAAAMPSIIHWRTRVDQAMPWSAASAVSSSKTSLGRRSDRLTMTSGRISIGSVLTRAVVSNSPLRYRAILSRSSGRIGASEDVSPPQFCCEPGLECGDEFPDAVRPLGEPHGDKASGNTASDRAGCLVDVLDEGWPGFQHRGDLSQADALFGRRVESVGGQGHSHKKAEHAPSDARQRLKLCVEDRPVGGLDLGLSAGGDLGQNVAAAVNQTALPQRATKASIYSLQAVVIEFAGFESA